jgi:molybdate transport system substrate-binding protein
MEQVRRGIWQVGFRFCALLVSLAVLAPGHGRAAGLTIYAASSLTDAFKDLGKLWAAKGHAPISFNFASSSVLAQQIEHGAQANIFASADELWMDRVQADHRIAPATRADIVANTLVLVEPKATLKPVSIKPGLDLAAILGPGGRLAVGDPAHVPAGIYAAQALRKLGLWESVKSRLAPAENVRSALMLVSAGEAPAGIVYGSDVKVAPGVGVAGTFPAESHDPIRYPAAATSQGGTKEALAFLAFLHTQPAQTVFAQYGFLAP